jgi:hypothetical protein
MITLLIILVTYLNAPTPTITPTQIAQQITVSNGKFAGYSYGTFPGFAATVTGPYVAPINKPASFSALDTVSAINDIVATKGQAYYSAFFHRWFAFNTGGRAAGHTGVTYAPNLGSFDHEMLHQFVGIGEAHATDCNAVECKFVPYGDQADIMGSLGGGHPNPFFKRQGKWLDAPGVPSTQLVTTSGRYTIAPYETLAGVKALVLSPGVDPKRGSFSELFISARGGTNIGLHTCCSLIHDLDLTGVTRDYRLDIGQSATFGTARITTVSASATGAVIDVVFNAATPPPPPPPPVQSNLALLSYLGGSLEDQVRDVARDAQGHIWLAGGTQSGVTPTVGQGFGGSYDAFVRSYTVAGQLRCSAAWGGPAYERAYWMEIAPDGDVVIGGRAGINAPVTLGPTFGAYVTTVAAYGPQKPFVAKFSPDCVLRWARYLDGDGTTISRDGAVNALGIYAGLAHVSTDLSFVPPTALDATRNGIDGALALVSHDGLSVTGTYYGGTNHDGNNPSIRVDASGVYWLTTSQSPDFPVSPGAAQANCGSPTSQRFAVIKLSLDLSTRLFATCGGAGGGGFETHHLAVLPDGSTAMTFYAPGQLPTTPGVMQPTYGGGGNDVGIAVLNSTGTQFTAISHFGGTSQDWPEGLAVLPDGRLAMSGQTQSTSTFIPGACGAQDAFLAVVSADLTRVDLAQRVCGAGWDQGRIVEVYDVTRLIWGGYSNGTLPVVNAPQPTRGGSWDGFWGVFTLPQPPAPNGCATDPLLPVVSITAPGHTVTWTLAGTITVTDERPCTVQVLP